MEGDERGSAECVKRCMYGHEHMTIRVGVCAMEKKSKGKAMREMLHRLEEFPCLYPVVFEERSILAEPIESWPACDCLISFHSRGFPLTKAQAYANLRRPYIINDLEMQSCLHDRRTVYKILQNANIEIPGHVIVDDQKDLQEFEDHICINGVDFPKPFVEKPVSAEDHNIYMYFPSTAGGGTQRLFRKTDDKSSVYTSDSNIRRDGVYLYEEFLPTDGTDVKVYAVGPNYAHAEARKSPGLDGKVRRDAEGKEIRYPVILTPAEKLIARKVCLAFKQTVCGFDMLRANGKSYVCDVNGFSFVKTSGRYYHDCARILAHMIFRHFGIPIQFPRVHIQRSISKAIAQTSSSQGLELRCLVAVIRHGDRTPKQKIKVHVKHVEFLKLYKKYVQENSSEVRLKKPNQLQEVLNIVRELLANNKEIELREQFEQMRFVLEMKGRFSGINRKVELKTDVRDTESVEVVTKWGGELTELGKEEAQELGVFFRNLYPEGQKDSPETQGLGLLRLHSTFRHDLKIYASNEGRVQLTAAAFAKGFLALEGELPPILVHMVKIADNRRSLFSDDYAAHDVQKDVKSRLYKALQYDRILSEEDKLNINPSQIRSVSQALDAVGNPVELCREIALLMSQLIDEIKIKRRRPYSLTLYHYETWDFLHRRWRKHFKDFQQSESQFNLSRIPDIYDSIKYDLRHNKQALGFQGIEDLFFKAQLLANIIIPQENGLTKDEKVTIGSSVCKPLLQKIQVDLQRNLVEEAVHRLDPKYSAGIATPERHVRTRLYFASESHIHSLLTVLLNAAPWSEDTEWKRALTLCSEVTELNFLSQLVIMMYENPKEDLNSDERFQIEIHFSPGVWGCNTTRDKETDETDDSAFIAASNDLVEKTPREGADAEGGKAKEGIPRFRSASLSRSPDTTRRNSLSPARDAKLQAGVPAVRPLMTLHSSLSYAQVDRFLAAIAHS